jgi:F-type H+-transporting ATPase subunit a
LGDFINEAISFNTVFTIHIFGLNIPISETVIASWGVILVIAILCFVASRHLSMVPGKLQVVTEMLVDLINKTCEEHIGKHWWAFAPYFGAIALFIFISSIAGILSPVMVGGIEPVFTIKPPTRDVNVTAALASITIFFIIFGSIYYNGVGGWIKSFVIPTPMMLPVTLMEYVVKPLTLALRLFGNILGAFIIMRLIEYLLPIFLPPIMSLYFDFFDATIQTLVFVLLSIIYIGESINVPGLEETPVQEKEVSHG